MAIIYSNQDSFENDIKSGLVLVDFFANWCGPCKMLSPVLESISVKRNDVKIIKVDVDNSQLLAKKYGIMSIPAMLIFKDGKFLDSKIGFMDEDSIINWIDETRVKE